MKNPKSGFPAFIRQDTHSLFIGTLPGDPSIASGQYYGNPRNAFWRICMDLLNKGQWVEDYQQRIDILLDNGFGLWDVLRKADRRKSLDQDIKDEVYNDFGMLFETYPNIQKLFFNGQNAWKYFKRIKEDNWNKEYILLPSTSPANARQRYDDKRNIWKAEILLK